jgi:hypothetical protein
VLVRIVPALASALAGIAAMTAPAAGSPPSAYQAVLHVYEQRSTVPPCQFSPAQLQSALKGVDAYGAQYFADFTQAIQNALSVRASGSCSPSARPPSARPPNARPPGARPPGGAATGHRLPVPVGPPARFGPVIAATSAGVPAPLALMGALAATGALCGAGIAAARAREKRRRRPPVDGEASP